MLVASLTGSDRIKIIILVLEASNDIDDNAANKPTKMMYMMYW
ncbi:MAG: hypothetical protein ACJ71J_02465 [Nitrososphaeraceae archaeon]